MTGRNRVIVLLVALLVLGGIGGWAVVHSMAVAGQRDQPQAGGPQVGAGNVSLAATGEPRRLLFRSTAWGPHRDELATVPADHPDAPRTASGVKCLRFYAAGGTGLCLRGDYAKVPPTNTAVIVDDHLRDLHSFPLAGAPTRARVSPSGRMVAWTVFTGGDTYAGGNFSTRTSIVDTRDWSLQDNLEEYSITRDDRPYKSPDLNIWGVTFADDQTFYATLATAGERYLVRGDAAAHTLTTMHTNVECPSLSPDGTRIAYKKRIPGKPAAAPWQLYVLDLATQTETPLAESRNVDDQALWLDNDSLAYSLPGDYLADLWTVPANGTGTPHKLLNDALSPTLLG